MFYFQQQLKRNNSFSVFFYFVLQYLYSRSSNESGEALEHREKLADFKDAITQGFLFASHWEYFFTGHGGVSFFFNLR